MGACCSKTSSTITSTPTPPEVKIKPAPDQPEKNNTASAIVTDQEAPKKEVLIVKHRKSQETDRNPDQITRKSTDRKEKGTNSITNSDISPPVATTSGGGVLNSDSGKVVGATVRTSSCTKEEVDAILIQCGRLSRSSSGVKPAGGETPTRGRRYSGSKRSFDFDMEMGSKNDDDEAAAVDGDHHRRRQQREHRVSSPSSRRRSRERDPQQQRSGSKERGGGNGRRVSRSPNRRSESPNPNSNGTSAASGGSNRPGKMVSVPATEKSNNAGGGEVAAGVGGAVKKIQVKRNAGDASGHRTAASPRSRSPARTNLRVLNENQTQQQVTLSRSNSRKAEHSPYRRNPLGEIDTNAAGEPPKKQNCEKMINNKTYNVKNCTQKEAQMTDEIKTTVENPKQNQIVSRTRSSRLSRELDINPEALLNPGSNPNPNSSTYATLLLEDIQNFHHKNPTAAVATAAPPPAFTIPACVSKACSILEAVADLNSTTSSNDLQFKKENLMECEKVVNDDLMEPSLHKYVTVKRGSADADAEEQESSGSNSFAGSQHPSWMSSSWEPNSGDSTDRWTSNSRSNGQDTEAHGEYPRSGIGRGRVGIHGRSAYSLPNTTTVAST